MRIERKKEEEKLGDMESAINGDLRGNLALMSSEEMIRAMATNEAFLSEASRHGGISLLMRGRGVFSSSSSSFSSRSLAMGGAYDLGRGEDTISERSLVSRKVQMPLRFLTNRCDLQDRMGEGSCFIWWNKVIGVQVQSLRGRCRKKKGTKGGWEDNCLVKFNRILGFLIEGFKGEILNMIQRIRSRREKGKKKVCSVSTLFDRKLKRLECLINYNRGKKGMGWIKDEGPKRSVLHAVEDFVLER